MAMYRALFVLFIALASGSAQADPYRWCAVYGGGSFGGGTNCYFMTLEQCRAAISGNGGFCAPNNFYDGQQVMAPQDAGRRAKRNGR
jgi:hypothetical protein